MSRSFLTVLLSMPFFFANAATGTLTVRFDDGTAKSYSCSSSCQLYCFPNGVNFNFVDENPIAVGWGVFINNGSYGVLAGINDPSLPEKKHNGWYGAVNNADAASFQISMLNLAPGGHVSGTFYGVKGSQTDGMNTINVSMNGSFSGTCKN